MFNIISAFVIFFGLFLLLALSVALGKRAGKWQIAHHKHNKLEIVNVAEGTVFALLGLIVAFTFTGAYDRFEKRKLHIIEEANAVETAYQRISLLAPRAQPALRNTIREYVDLRIAVYKKIPDFTAIKEMLMQSEQLQTQIWDQVVAACKITNDTAVTELVVLAINNMFEVENTGFAITKVHAPVVIFLLLIGLGILGTFLVGFSAAENQSKRSVHVLIYILITAFTIYLIIDLELPRMGLIRVDAFDQLLINVREHMH